MLEKIRSVTVAHSACCLCAPTLVVWALVAVCPQALFWCLNAAALSLHHSLPVAVVAAVAAVEGLAAVADSASEQPLGAELAELAADGQPTVTVAAALVAARPLAESAMGPKALKSPAASQFQILVPRTQT